MLALGAATDRFFGKGFLGDLGKGERGRITIHVLKSVTYSYTAWVPASLVSAGGLKIGAMASLALRRVDVARKSREWICWRICIE